MDAKHALQGQNKTLITKIILAAGAVIAIALCPFGSWFIRAGVAVALLAAAAIYYLLNKEIDDQQVAADHRAQRDLAAQVAIEKRHHAESMSTIVRFTARVSALKATIETLQAELEDSERRLVEQDNIVAGLRSTQDTMAANAAELRQRIVSLEEKIALRENELNELLDHLESAEIVAMPRRLQLSSRVENVVVESYDEDYELPQAAGH